MTVKELITKLQELDGDLLVARDERYGHYTEVDEVVVLKVYKHKATGYLYDSRFPETEEIKVVELW